VCPCLTPAFHEPGFFHEIAVPIRNVDLMREIVASKASGVMSSELARLLIQLATEISRKGCFRGYSYREEFVAEAVLQLVKVWHRFDNLKFNNPHAYYTACCFNSFRRILRVEKNSQLIRDECRMMIGESASYSQQIDHEMAEWDNPNIQPPSEGVVLKVRRGRPP
jgi:hypothetical protein